MGEVVGILPLRRSPGRVIPRGARFPSNRGRQATIDSATGAFSFSSGTAIRPLVGCAAYVPGGCGKAAKVRRQWRGGGGVLRGCPSVAPSSCRTAACASMPVSARASIGPTGAGGGSLDMVSPGGRTGWQVSRPSLLAGVPGSCHGTARRREDHAWIRPGHGARAGGPSERAATSPGGPRRWPLPPRRRPRVPVSETASAGERQRRRTPAPENASARERQRPAWRAGRGGVWRVPGGLSRPLPGERRRPPPGEPRRHLQQGPGHRRRHHTWPRSPRPSAGSAPRR